MTVTTARKYNPGFLSDAELIASFCVRTWEFESIVEMLRECTGRSNKHQIVIGPRGSGKTSLLLRVAAEVRRDADLAAGFFPIVFAEESYEVCTAGEFWLECLARLADQAPKREDAPNLHRTLDDMRAIRDDQQLGERCLATVLDFADREDKRLVLMVENLNMMFRDMTDRDAGWRLRKVLQTEPRIILLASATSRFDEIDHPDNALYEQLREITLHRLTTEECAVLWETVSGQNRPPGTIRSLEILTGGSPRLLAIVARFGAGLSFRALMDNLLDLVDDHTEYFKSHLESLPPQERRVYLAVAELWKPALTKEIAERARIETSVCSAQLKRLVERGAVLVAGGSARRKQYYLSERMYNIYYLMRRSRGLDRFIEVLIEFMAMFYSRAKLKEIGTRTAREAEEVLPEMRPRYLYASARLMALSVPPKQPKEMQTASDVDAAEYMQTMTARTLFDKGVSLSKQNHYEDALATYDELLRRFGKATTAALLTQGAKTLFNKAVTLGSLNQPEEALTTYSEVLRRFGESETAEIQESVARALVNRGNTRCVLNRPDEALADYDEALRRFGESETAEIQESVARALVNRGNTRCVLNRPDEALADYDEALHRFGESEMPGILEQVATALFNKGIALGELNRSDDELAAYDEVLHRFGESQAPEVLGTVARALVNRGVTLGALNRSEEALADYDEVLRRFGESETPELLEEVAKALVNKGATLGSLEKPEEELVTYDDVLRRFGGSETPAILENVARALVYKGLTLGALNRPEEALATYDDVLDRFGRIEVPELLDQVAMALVGKGMELAMLSRPTETTDVAALLAILPRLDALPVGAPDALMAFSVDLGPERMLELIEASPAHKFLLPLTTALEWEVGRRPRVPQEVSEVAEDIRKEMAKMREARSA